MSAAGLDYVGIDVISVLLVLLPGFLAAGIVQSLCVRPSETEFDKVVEALLYSFLSYVAFVAVVHRMPIRVVAEHVSPTVDHYTPEVRTGDMFLLLGIGTAIGLLVSLSITNDLHTRLLRKLHLSRRTTRTSVWSDAFHSHHTAVEIQFTDRRLLMGVPVFYSDTPREGSLFLKNAAWVARDGTLTPIPGPGILITKNMPIETIMFLDPPKPAAPRVPAASAAPAGKH